jgi:hypothetical protein
MSACHQNSITDAAFKHLRGIHTLNMFYCNQVGITDAAFEHLRGINTLDMRCCDQAGITYVGIAKLRGIHKLNELIVSEMTWEDTVSRLFRFR